MSLAVVHENWKLVTNKDSSYFELYDIAASPYEKKDLREEKPELAASLLKKIADWKSTLPEKPKGDVFSAERSR